MAREYVLVLVMTPSQKAAIKRYREKQVANGVKIVSLPLSSRARETLRNLAKSYGSQAKAIESILGGD